MEQFKKAKQNNRLQKVFMKTVKQNLDNMLKIKHLITTPGQVIRNIQTIIFTIRQTEGDDKGAVKAPCKQS